MSNHAPENPQNFFDVMNARGLVAQTTDENIRNRFAPGSAQVSAYCGFDPTADSLHVGSLVPIMGLAHLQRCGHRPIIIVGGGTGMVGDPSGKTEARKMLTREQIDHNAQCIAAQIARVVSFGDPQNPRPTDAIMLNNADWLAKLNWIDMLRDIGPHFSVNRMLTMDSVKGRMTGEGDGISFLEFNYMIMQAYDFVHLYKHHRCTVQLGGQDQWGNIVMGIELGRRTAAADLAGLTFPLVTKADGGKFGKSEQGNIWLDARRTSPYEFFQFWRNVNDADVSRYLKYFTFLPPEECELPADADGGAINAMKEKLAFEVTQLIHGEAEARAALDSAKKAFGEGDVTGDAIPHAPLDPAKLPASLLDLMVEAQLAASKGEARRLIQGGGVKLHDDKITDVAQTITSNHIRDGYVLVRVGKKKLFRFDVG